MSQRLPFDARVPAADAEMRQAATVLLVRDAADGAEVFMLERPAAADFGGMMVFPGGKVDDTDRHEALVGFCAGLDDGSASSQLGVASGGLAYWVAAVRECFEECGVLLAYDTDGELLDLADPADATRFHAYRTALNTGHEAFFDLCHREGMQLATDRMLYFAHWVTPVGPPRRYDTRFFITGMPPRQAGQHDRQELVASCWLRPETALDRFHAGELGLIYPTIKTLESICGFASAQALLDHVMAGRHWPDPTEELVREGLQPGADPDRPPVSG